jgi:LysR family transcriptional regulator, low CO2-responsive transcriptional regulator
MNYTLHQLKVFLKICENESITKAAQELNLSQPAVSIQFKNFQDQFSLPLYEVIGKKVYITEFGREIATTAKKIIQEVEEIDIKTNEFKGLLTGKTKLSVVSTGQYIMPYFINDFFLQHPGLDLFLDTTNKSQVMDALKDNQTDFALISILPESIDLNYIELLPNHLFLVCNKKIWDDHRGDSKEILEKYPFLLREEGSATRFASEKFLTANKIMISKKIELKSNETVKQAVLAGMGISIIPLIGMKNQLIEGSLKIIPMQGLPLVTDWRLVWLKEKSLSPSARAFLKYIIEQKESFTVIHFGWIKDYVDYDYS